jgi:hypothetical protein
MITYENKGYDKKSIPKINVEHIEGNGRSYFYLYSIGDLIQGNFHRGCRNPTLAKCGGEAQHLEKVRIWSPPRLPNV